MHSFGSQQYTYSEHVLTQEQVQHIQLLEMFIVDWVVRKVAQIGQDLELVFCTQHTEEGGYAQREQTTICEAIMLN